MWDFKRIVILVALVATGAIILFVFLAEELGAYCEDVFCWYGEDGNAKENGGGTDAIDRKQC